MTADMKFTRDTPFAITAYSIVTGKTWYHDDIKDWKRYRNRFRNIKQGHQGERQTIECISRRRSCLSSWTPLKENYTSVTTRLTGHPVICLQDWKTIQKVSVKQDSLLHLAGPHSLLSVLSWWSYSLLPWPHGISQESRPDWAIRYSICLYSLW